MIEGFLRHGFSGHQKTRQHEAIEEERDLGRLEICTFCIKCFVVNTWLFMNRVPILGDFSQSEFLLICLEGKRQ